MPLATADDLKALGVSVGSGPSDDVTAVVADRLIAMAGGVILTYLHRTAADVAAMTTEQRDVISLVCADLVAGVVMSPAGVASEALGDHTVAYQGARGIALSNQQKDLLGQVEPEDDPNVLHSVKMQSATAALAATITP